jgi:hypothetical protein
MEESSFESITSYETFRQRWSEYCTQIAQSQLSKKQCEEKRVRMHAVLKLFATGNPRAVRSNIRDKLGDLAITLDNSLTTASNNYEREIGAPRAARRTALILGLANLVATVLVLLIVLLKK